MSGSRFLFSEETWRIERGDSETQYKKRKILSSVHAISRLWLRESVFAVGMSRARGSSFISSSGYSREYSLPIFSFSRVILLLGGAPEERRETGDRKR